MNRFKMLKAIFIAIILLISTVLSVYGFEFLGKSLVLAIESKATNFFDIGLKISLLLYVFSFVGIYLSTKLEKVKVKNQVQ